MGLSHQQLREVPWADLIAAYDREATHVSSHLQLYHNEIVRREVDEQTRTIVKFTRAMTFMTVVITVATIFNVFIVAAPLWQRR